MPDKIEASEYLKCARCGGKLILGEQRDTNHGTHHDIKTYCLSCDTASRDFFDGPHE